MGNAPSTPAPPTPAVSTHQKPADATASPAPAGGSPHGHHARAMMGGGAAGGPPGLCPVVHDKGGSGSGKKRPIGPVYNVYSQEIDLTNMMPAAAAQQPAPGQTAPLSVERVKSTITKGGTEGTWVYPSPQMFYNALVRKGKAEGVDTGDVDMVVSIHNEMNERTWGQLLAWEARHKGEHLEGEPALRRFQGNPWEPSLKARSKALLGYGWPFDRHDWYVDRAGKPVHYIIDYYYNPTGPALSPAEVSALKVKHTHMIHVDVRPAVEDAGSVLDRLLAFPARASAALSRPRFLAEGLDPAKAPPPEAQEPHGDAAKVATAPPLVPPSAGSKWEEVDVKCGPLLATLQGMAAGEEDARRSTSVALNYCMGRILAPAQADAFFRVLEDNSKGGVAGNAGGKEEKAFAAMTAAVLAEVRNRPADKLQ